MHGKNRRRRSSSRPSRTRLTFRLTITTGTRLARSCTRRRRARPGPRRQGHRRNAETPLTASAGAIAARVRIMVGLLLGCDDFERRSDTPGCRTLKVKNEKTDLRRLATIAVNSIVRARRPWRSWRRSWRLTRLARCDRHRLQVAARACERIYPKEWYARSKP